MKLWILSPRNQNFLDQNWGYFGILGGLGASWGPREQFSKNWHPKNSWADQEIWALKQKPMIHGAITSTLACRMARGIFFDPIIKLEPVSCCYEK
jgi:hypothetical protein